MFHPSLLPAEKIHRLERAGLIAGKWETRGGVSRELKYYRLTAIGRQRLHTEASKWTQLVKAIGRVMRPAEG